jgi:hypothetical protein
MDEQMNRMWQLIQMMQQNDASQNDTKNIGGADWRFDMLTAMRPMLPYQKQRIIDLLIKAMEMQEILNELGATSNSI